MSSRDGLRYQDPLELIWVETARRLGMQVQRSAEVYASWDGRGVMTLSDSAGMDPDDCLAQMILHELCHALVQGPAAFRKVDWGMDNIDDRDVLAEHAADRLQAALADRHGLRRFMGLTTVYREYYDALPPHPLAPGPDPAIALAQEGYLRATRGPWAKAIEDALKATAALARVCAPFTDASSLWAQAQEPHPLGLPPGQPGRSCAGCAWRTPDERCRQADAPLDPSWPACSRWEAPLTEADCAACGACCREAYHQVPLDPDSPLLQSHPEWVQQEPEGPVLPRPGGDCVALRREARGFRCAVYAQRPSSCRDFELGGEHCLTARRRVGLSG